MKKIKILKIQIRSAQNVGKVWINRKKSSRPYLGPSEAIFSMDRKNQKNAKILPIFLGGPMGPIHPVWALAAIHPRWGNRYFGQFTAVAAWWVERGVRLGSESSSGGVGKSRILEIWKFADLGTWKSGNLEIWRPGNPEFWGSKNPKNDTSVDPK